MPLDPATPEQGRIDPRRLRDALGRFATSVTIATTRGPDGTLEGVTAASLWAVSLDPPLVLWSFKRNSRAPPGLQHSGFFAVNVLAASQTDLSHRFTRPGTDKYAGAAFTPGLGGCPLLPDPLATFEYATEMQVEGGGYVIFVGRVYRTIPRDGTYCPARVRTAVVRGGMCAAQGGGAAPQTCSRRASRPQFQR